MKISQLPSWSSIKNKSRNERENGRLSKARIDFNVSTWPLILVRVFIHWLMFLFHQLISQSSWNCGFPRPPCTVNCIRFALNIKCWDLVAQLIWFLNNPVNRSNSESVICQKIVRGSDLLQEAYALARICLLNVVTTDLNGQKLVPIKSIFCSLITINLPLLVTTVRKTC